MFKTNGMHLEKVSGEPGNSFLFKFFILVEEIRYSQIYDWVLSQTVSENGVDPGVQSQSPRNGRLHKKHGLEFCMMCNINSWVNFKLPKRAVYPMVHSNKKYGHYGHVYCHILITCSLLSYHNYPSTTMQCTLGHQTHHTQWILVLRWYKLYNSWLDLYHWSLPIPEPRNHSQWYISAFDTLLRPRS